MPRPRKITREELQEKLNSANEIIEMQKKQIEDMQQQYSNIVTQEQYNILLKQYDALQAQYQDLRNLYNKKDATKHNARGAGRKQKYNDDVIAKCKELHKQLLSYSVIAEKMNMSKSTVYKLINSR